MSATAGPAGRREATKQANREAILAAARETFTELGYGAATVRDIVRRTGLASGTFYNHFPDKEAVFRELIDVSARELRRRVRERRRRARAPGAFVGEGFSAFFAFLGEDPALLALLRRNAGSVRALLDDPILGSAVEELREDLRDAIAAGDVPALDAEYMAAAMSGAAFEIAVRMLERDPVDAASAARFATELFLGGIARVGAVRRDPRGAPART